METFSIESKLNKWFLWIADDDELIFHAERLIAGATAIYGTTYRPGVVARDDNWMLSYVCWAEMPEQEARNKIVKWGMSL